jgi:hypothetical protein
MRLIVPGLLACLLSQSASAANWRVVERRPRLTLSIDKDSLVAGTGGTVVYWERQDWHVPAGGIPPLVQLDAKVEANCRNRTVRVLWLTGRLKDGSTTQDAGREAWEYVPRGTIMDATYRLACRWRPAPHS